MNAPNPRPLRIALVIDTLAGGGSEHCLRRLAHGLAARGQAVFVYCLRTPGIDCNPLAAAGVTVRAAESQGRDLSLPVRLGRWLATDRINLVHAHSCAALVASFLPAKWQGRTVVHVWHGWPLGSPSRHHLLARTLDRWVAGIGLNSQALRTRLHPRLAACAVHLPNGLDLPALPRGPARQALAALAGCTLDGPVLLSIGNLRPEKGTLDLLLAFSRLRRDWPRARLLLVGGVIDRAYAVRVATAVETLQLETHVHWCGPQPDAWKLLAGADVFCLSSRSESMPNVVLEAMTQGVPIVATAVGDVGALPSASPDDAPHTDLLLRSPDTALLVPPASPAALAAALHQSLGDPGAALRRAAHAQREAQARFSNTAMVGRYEAFYHHALTRCGPNRSNTQPARARILMLGPAPPQTGGMVTSIQNLLRGPLSADFDLALLPTTQRSTDSGRTPWILGRCTAMARHVRALHTLWHRLRSEPIALLHIHTCSGFTFWRNLLDVAIAHTTGTRVALHIRGGGFADFLAALGPGRRLLARTGLAWADAVIVLSSGWRKRLWRYSPCAHWYIVPNAYDPALLAAAPRASTTPPDRPCRFLFLGPLTRAKGLTDLLVAGGLLKERHIPCELLIAGPATPEELGAWQRQAAALELTTHTHWLGPIAPAERPALFASADCFVHPSHCEGAPNVVLEAAAAGLPLVATAVGALPEIFAPLAAHDGEWLAPLVPPGDATVLAKYMAAFATNPKYRARAAAACHQHIRDQYGPARTATALSRVYAAVLPGVAPRVYSSPAEDTVPHPAQRSAIRAACSTITAPAPPVLAPIGDSR
ncbi:MAG: glycosyltransferase [Phycisphaerales bacterium]|nr:glycosyltransferase [Phycisphaerales bacterium]